MACKGQPSRCRLVVNRQLRDEQARASSPPRPHPWRCRLCQREGVQASRAGAQGNSIWSVLWDRQARSALRLPSSLTLRALQTRVPSGNQAGTDNVSWWCTRRDEHSQAGTLPAGLLLPIAVALPARGLPHSRADASCGKTWWQVGPVQPHHCSKLRLLTLWTPRGKGKSRDIDVLQHNIAHLKELG